jgi:hypothetical protein
VKVVGEPGKPKKKGAKLPTAKPDWRAVPAGRVTRNDAFGAWEAELQKYGFAIIHNKIVVIDPFSDNCTVVTGSHNLGFRASHNNDENMLIIRGHRGLAEAYACHVLDLYDHYAWRYFLNQHADVFGKPLQPDDTWQERYIIGKDVKSPELRFWLSAATRGVAPPRPRARAPVPKRSTRSAKGARTTAAKSAGRSKESSRKKSTKTSHKAVKKSNAKKRKVATRSRTKGERHK